jgi:hypothetical protein
MTTPVEFWRCAVGRGVRAVRGSLFWHILYYGTISQLLYMLELPKSTSQFPLNHMHDTCMIESILRARD